MAVVSLAHQTDREGWRKAARALRLAEIPPEAVAWRVGEGDLFTDGEPIPPAQTAAFNVPREFMDLARDVICHRDEGRFALLYRLLWRLKDEPGLLALVTDPDVARGREMAKSVHRAQHKMRAFVRFREVKGVEPETFVAWFESPHRVLELNADFFVRRFANHRFSILTPDGALHWDGTEVRLEETADRSAAPAEDELEDFWRTYYASIFNPARLKVGAMTSEMPKRYWRNLPEARLIPELIESAGLRMEAMVASEPTTPKRRIAPAVAAHNGPVEAALTAGALPEIGAGVNACRCCDLWRDATQGVPGEGPAHAPLMLVGEQPGDQEDLAGHPFVGPAGQLLDRALQAAGVVRSDVFVTNAVKHFKHELRGKRRLHKTPDSGEINACRWWLDQERSLVKPKVVVALGGTAAQAVFGKVMPILKSRGRPFDLGEGTRGFITVHPSYLLRLPDEAAKEPAFRAFVADLAAARELLAA